MHIPFCKQACNYCNFHFTTSMHYKQELVQALCEEIDLQKEYLGGETIHTIYFGGGTPSLLQIADCQLLIDHIQSIFPIAINAEITLEANPDDITSEKLKGWKNAGINRLSIGIQSFFERDLRWMNRAHNAKQSTGNLHLALEYFDNISIDLIYGSPLFTDEMWQQNVQTALSYNIPHLSCYALTVEEKTPLHKQISLKQNTDVDNDTQAHQFTLLMQWLRNEGYEHYEVSNFAKAGYRSRHNSMYWSGEKYLGLGPSAHSYDGSSRQWNVANNSIYISSISNGRVPCEMEVLTETQKLNEHIMISLRTIEGLDLQLIENKWGREMRETIAKNLQRFNNKFSLSDSVIQLTDEGILIADGIAAELFIHN
ncbi:MAG: radical SAM family heme chaperone HemW [Chitinophagaceae bacterium]